ncbi:MAG: hypothetical protein WDK95_01560 [Syntrophorhabdaceae bacterium]
MKKENRNGNGVNGLSPGYTLLNGQQDFNEEKSINVGLQGLTPQGTPLYEFDFRPRNLIFIDVRVNRRGVYSSFLLAKRQPGLAKVCIRL